MDPEWSNDTRDDLFDDLGYGVGLHTFAKTIEFFLHPQNAAFLQVCTDEALEAAIDFDTLRITACNPDTDLDANGFIYWALEDEQPGAGQGRLRGYKGPVRDNSAGNERVCSGSAADGATITLAPESGYTFAATVKLNAGAAVDSARGQIIVPPIKRLRQLYDGTGQDDNQILTFWEGILRRMRGGAITMKAAAAEANAFFMRTKARRLLKGKSHESAIILPDVRQTQGVVVYRPSGLAHDITSAMEDNSVGAGEVKVAAGAFSGSVAYPSGGWAGSAATPSYGQRALSSIITMRCVEGLGATPPKFRPTRSLTDRRRAPNEGKDDEVLTDRLLWIGKEWKAREWGIEALTVNYLPTIDGLGSDALLSTTATDWTCTGLTDENSTDGKVFLHYDGATLKAYASEEGRTNEDDADVVAQRTTAASEDATVVTLDPVNDSGLTIVGKTGAGSGGNLVTDSVGDVDFNPPSPNDPVSQFTITITETTEVGVWGEAARDEVFGTGQAWHLNSGASPNVVDGQAVKCLPMVNASVQGDRT
jgi:hypothetical protein